MGDVPTFMGFKLVKPHGAEYWWFRNISIALLGFIIPAFFEVDMGPGVAAYKSYLDKLGHLRMVRHHPLPAVLPHEQRVQGRDEAPHHHELDPQPSHGHWSQRCAHLRRCREALNIPNV